MAISKNQISAIKKLQQKKFRQSLGKFVVEGEKMASEALNQNIFPIDEVYAYPEVAKEIRNQKPNLVVFEVNEKELSRISSLKTPNKVLIVLKMVAQEESKVQVEEDLSLYLEGIRDPGNMGTIIRTADWFGIKHVFISPDCVEPFNPKVIQACMGALFRVNVISQELSELKRQYPDLPIYATILEGENVFKAAIQSKGLLLIGNESQGLTEEAKNMADLGIMIPKAVSGGAESLNAAIATSIICAVFRAKGS